MQVIKLLLSIISLLGFCRKSTAKNDESGIQKKTPFFYGTILYEKFCYVSDKSLICGKENSGNATFLELNNHQIESVAVYSNFTNILRKVCLKENLDSDQLLLGREESIKSLKLSNNSITFIEDKTFDAFVSLETLYFNYSNITSIDEKVLTKKVGSHLVTLRMDDCNILFLSPSTFQFLTNLFELSLDGNLHVGRFINNGIFTKSLKKLSWLSLKNCNITVLDEDVFANLTNLEYLLLSRNPFTSIPKAINIIPKLFLLSLGFSNIKSIQKDKELFNKNLKILSIGGSKELTNIEDCVFCNFPSLYSIELSQSSKLSQIHPNVFGSVEDIPGLLEVRIESCNISSLPEMLLQRKIKLYLADNPINGKGIVTVNV